VSRVYRSGLRNHGESDSTIARQAFVVRLNLWIEAGSESSVNHGGHESRLGFSEADCLPARSSSGCLRFRGSPVGSQNSQPEDGRVNFLLAHSMDSEMRDRFPESPVRMITRPCIESRAPSPGLCGIRKHGRTQAYCRVRCRRGICRADAGY
jgi:hypothetical protein